jgi:hypothetical protein
MASLRAVYWRLEELRKRRDPAGIGRFFAVMLPVLLAGAMEDTSDVSPYLHTVLDVFAGWLPMLVIAVSASAIVSLDGERRARRSLRPRPKVAYLLLALGLAAAGVVSGLAAWAAGARPTGPGVGEDWIATGLVWSTMICICATVMMAACALTAPSPRRAR